MNKITCNIIQDLLPSYVDALCSEDSKKIVEEHITKCEICKMQKERMQEEEFKFQLKSPDELEYMKKIKRKINLKFFTFLFFLIGISAAFLLHLNATDSILIFYLVLPILLFCNYFLSFHSSEKKKEENRKKKLVFYLFYFGIILYPLFLMLVLLERWLKFGNLPFGLSFGELGFFVYQQLFFIILVEIIVWISSVIIYLKTFKNLLVLRGMSIIGFCIVLYYIRLLGNLSDFETYFRNSLFALGILLEGLIFIGGFWLLENRRRQESF